MMKKEDRYLAAAVWGTKKMTDIWKRGSALDFNIFNLKWAVNFGLFPIRYSEFKEKFEELFFYKNETIYPEPVLMIRFLQAIAKSIEIPSENLLRKIAEEHVYRMKEREPVCAECGTRYDWLKEEQKDPEKAKAYKLIWDPTRRCA